MNAEIRRQNILKLLSEKKNPTSATALAKEFSVSRQIIVGDIALLRACGENIYATPRGYVLSGESENQSENGIIKTIACTHKGEQMTDELQICVDNGCTVIDVIVEHPVYGQLTGSLQIASRFDIEEFNKKINSYSAHALSELTDGIHLHTLKCPSEEAYLRVCAKLKECGILLN